MDHEFTFVAEVLRSKDAAQGDEEGFVFWGKASSTDLDRAGESLTSNAIRKLQNGGPVDIILAPSHQEALASVSGLFAIGDPQMRGDNVYLLRCSTVPNHPFERGIRWLIENHPQSLSMSISGRVPPNALIRRARERLIDEVIIDHVLLCRSGAATLESAAVWADKSNWIAQISKAAFPDEYGPNEQQILVSGVRVEHLLADLTQQRNAQIGKVADDVEDVSNFLKTNLRTRRAP